MTLRPQQDITKILLSTSSYLVGEYEEEDLLLTIAFHDYRDGNSIQHETLDHEYFMLAMKTPPLDTFDDTFPVTIPDYSPRGDDFCIYLSILYGKRFDNHGLVESVGNFWLPNYPPFSFYDPTLPFNIKKPRPDLEIPLNLREIKRIAPILHLEMDDRFNRFLLLAGRFYVHALQHAESQPEIAYMDLITCGETLSNFFDYDQDNLLDDQIKADFAQIGWKIENGEKIVKRIRGNMLQIKRKFLMTILHLLSPYFFQQTEATQPGIGVLKEDDILALIKAAYNLRSSYVHTGKNFGGQIKGHSRFNNEIRLGIRPKSIEKF